MKNNPQSERYYTSIRFFLASLFLSLSICLSIYLSFFFSLLYFNPNSCVQILEQIKRVRRKKTGEKKM